MSTYADRQAERDSAYSTAYCAWVASLAPAERAQLAAGGLSEPDATRHTCTRQHDDVTLDRTAAPEPTPDDLAELADEPAPVSPATPADATSAADVLASRPIATPLKMLDCCPVSDGGCAVVTSHDRWFLDKIATHILAFEGDSQVYWFEGNFKLYEANRHERLGADADNPHRVKYRKLG